MTFKKRSVTFDLNDIGSQVIDQISSDIYAGPGSILRELIKNAYDAYLPVDADELEEEGINREIQVSRVRDEDGTGHLYIADNGIGQSFEELRANVQISISKKPSELDDATGFRGLGSWAILGAGSNIIITSKTKNATTHSRLEINVRRIYEKMGGDTTLDDILNDPDCISFSTEEFKEGRHEHGTTVEIECDGPTETVNGFELNRLYDFTDPEEDKLKSILVVTCPIPFSSEGGGYKQIHEVYNRSRYIPTQLSLDGIQLERRLPSDLTEFHTTDITLAGNVAAIAWYVEDPKESGVLAIDDSKHLVGGSGIQLMRLNVPIGTKNIFCDGAARENLLNWYVGEVHIVMGEVLPNASGQDLRAGLSRELFIEQLQNFYKTLDQKSRHEICSNQSGQAPEARHGSSQQVGYSDSDGTRAAKCTGSCGKPRFIFRVSPHSIDGNPSNLVTNVNSPRSRLVWVGCFIGKYGLAPRTACKSDARGVNIPFSSQPP